MAGSLSNQSGPRGADCVRFCTRSPSMAGALGLTTGRTNAPRSVHSAEALLAFERVPFEPAAAELVAVPGAPDTTEAQLVFS